MRLFAVTLDCPDPGELAEFYRRPVGGHIAFTSVNFTVLVIDGKQRLDFQRVEPFTPPEWPDTTRPAQVHLDFEVDDLASGQRHALSVGATFAGVGSTGKFVVLTDPVGHPFCVSLPQPLG